MNVWFLYRLPLQITLISSLLSSFSPKRNRRGSNLLMVKFRFLISFAVRHKVHSSIHIRYLQWFPWHLKKKTSGKFQIYRGLTKDCTPFLAIIFLSILVKNALGNCSPYFKFNFFFLKFFKFNFLILLDSVIFRIDVFLRYVVLMSLFFSKCGDVIASFFVQIFCLVLQASR